ncbi:MAG: replicative DNA helicase [Bacteroidota bacterium]
MAEFQNTLKKTQKKKTKQSKFVRQDTSFTLLEHGKLPPQAIDLEEAVLGALMLEKDPLAVVIDKLKPESFYKEAHQIIFSAIQNLFQKSEPTDMLTVSNELKSSGELDLVGGPYYIAQLTGKVASTANTEYHAHIILQKFIQRELIRISSRIIEEAYEDTTDVFELLDNAESSLFGIAEGTIRGVPGQMKDLLGEAITQIEEAKKQKDGVTGIPSGFTKLDRITSGWQKSDLIVIASRPGMGKTSLVLSIARNVSVDFNIPVALFSLEMASIQLVTRLIANETELDAENLKRGRLEDHEWEQLHSKISGLDTAPLFIDDTPALSIFELRAKCRRLVAKHNIELIIVDYLQLMTSGMEGKGNREQEISMISRSLKSIAKELNVPIIALSQLSRAVETRGGIKRPQLSDLRESGAIEQDSDLVIFIYRPQYYALDEWEDGTVSTGQAEIIIAKHRNGQTGRIRLKFINRLAKFKDLEEDYFPLEAEPSGVGEIKTYTVESKMNEPDEEEPF